MGKPSEWYQGVPDKGSSSASSTSFMPSWSCNAQHGRTRDAWSWQAGGAAAAEAVLGQVLASCRGAASLVELGCGSSSLARASAGLSTSASHRRVAGALLRTWQVDSACMAIAHA